jgi:hypothetical protein
MSPSQFTFWLSGFLEAAGTNGLQQYQVNKILDGLKGVDYTPSYPVLDPTINPISYPTSNDEMVPYGTICGCNPANGGSGICGCIMGNKMVPKDYNTKSNLYTTTTELNGFNAINWGLKERTK